jgi:hypothetical protein
MTVTNGYASLAEFKAWVTVRGGTATTDATDDAVMEDILEQASRYIDAQTGRRFWKPTADETRYFTPEVSTRLDIADLSAAPTSVSVDYSNTVTRSYTALDTTDYDLLPENALTVGEPYTALEMRFTSGDYLPTQRSGVKIVGKFGWPSVPDNIKNDCLAIAHNIWMGRSGQTGSGRVSVTAGGIVIRPEDVPPMAMQDILTYRLYR